VLSIDSNRFIINNLRSLSVVRQEREKETRLTDGAVVLEGFGDLAAGQVTEVLHGRGARELQVRFLSHHSVSKEKALAVSSSVRRRQQREELREGAGRAVDTASAGRRVDSARLLTGYLLRLKF
jgi:hypothetical protein